MKLVNSKDINKILEDTGDPGDFFDPQKEELKSPCWQIQVDKARGDIVFLVDRQEVYSHPLEKSIRLTQETIPPMMKLLRANDINGLRSYVDSDA